MIGAVIHLGAGARSLTMQGHTWNLLDLDRNQTSTIAAMVAETAGIKDRKGGRNRTPRVRPSAQTIHN